MNRSSINILYLGGINGKKITRIELPHYRKNDDRAYKIFEDGSAMCVMYNDGQPKFRHIESEEFEEIFTNTKECTRIEFMQCHKKVKDYLNENETFFN